MQKPNQSREEYIEELKKKYGKLAEPTEFTDEIYIKLEESEEAIKNGRVYTMEEADAIMKKKYPFLKENDDFSDDKIIAEESEDYNAN